MRLAIRLTVLAVAGFLIGSHMRMHAYFPTDPTQFVTWTPTCYSLRFVPANTWNQASCSVTGVTNQGVGDQGPFTYTITLTVAATNNSCSVSGTVKSYSWGSSTEIYAGAQAVAIQSPETDWWAYPDGSAVQQGPDEVLGC